MTGKRLNLTLSDEAAEALAGEQQATGRKKVDIANRALVLYAFLCSESRSNAKIVLQHDEEPDVVLKLL